METKVENTIWGIADKARFRKFVESIPKTQKTYFEDWQNRVDKDSKSEFSPMITAFVVTAMEYSYRTEFNGTTAIGISAPTGVEKTYIVAAENYNKAYKAVEEYLKKEYPGLIWGFRSEASKLILDGTK